MTITIQTKDIVIELDGKYHNYRKVHIKKYGTVLYRLELSQGRIVLSEATMPLKLVYRLLQLLYGRDIEVR